MVAGEVRFLSALQVAQVTYIEHMNNVLNTLLTYRVNAVLQSRYFASHPDRYYVVLPVGALEVVTDEYYGTTTAKIGTPTPVTKGLAYGTAARTRDGSGAKAKHMRCAEYWEAEIATLDKLIAYTSKAE